MSEERPVEAGAEAPGERKPAGGRLLRGTPVAPGLAMGPAHRKDYDLSRAAGDRVPLEAVEGELNRFHKALLDARRQLADLKEQLVGRVPIDDARILDVHVAYLKDSVFISDVENLILNEQLSLEAAIGKVITDFDRIFRLVQNETLRERAVDLRDVGIRVLRQLEEHRESTPGHATAPADYVLVARELSIVDMFNLRGEHVLGILAEEGGLTSHAAMLARSMRIPTLTGVQGLLEAVQEGAFVIVDAAEGSVRVDPDDVVRAQYREAQREIERTEESGGAELAGEPRTRDGERIEVALSCGSLPEVQQAALTGAPIGLYRTELLYLLDKEQPSRETLTRHYAAVLQEARGAQVTFRLLHADSSLELGYLHDTREGNPALGRGGVRALLAREEVLRRQLQALLRAASGGRARILVPFVTDTGELRRIKEVLFEERLQLRKSGEPFQEKVELGVVIENAGAVLGARELAGECDFLVISLDALTQHLLAADRENLEMRGWFDSLHPFVLRAVREVVAAAEQAQRPLQVFGFTALQPHNLPFLVGLGLRSFIAPGPGLREFLREIAQLDSRGARRAARTAAASSCQAETLSLVEGFRHGYARP